MNKTIITAVAAFIVMGTMVASVEEANAVVCARGVYRAGCAGRHGAVVARRPVVAPRRVVVAPRGVIVRRPIY
jgi:hypothetical protein